MWRKGARERLVDQEGSTVAAIRILLADDNRSILADLREELSSEFKILGAAENREEAIRAVLQLDPDVLILDITMPVLNGIQVAARLRETQPSYEDPFSYDS